MSCLFLMILGLTFFFIMQPGANITILRAGHLTFLPEGNLITQEACCFLANKSKQQILCENFQSSHQPVYQEWSGSFELKGNGSKIVNCFPGNP